MPASPELAAQLAKGTLEIYTAAEEHLLRVVARRLAEGIDEPGWAERKLAETQRLRGEVEATLAELRGDGAVEVDDAVRAAYNRGVATAGTDLASVGAAPQIGFGVTNQATVRALVAATVEQVESTHLRILRSVLDGYRDVVADAAGQAAAGSVSRREAAQQALARFASRGITGFVDSAGRSWDLASYTEMSVRTASGRAAVRGHVDRLVEAGHDLVIVSDAPQECPVCRPWEGRVLSITGASRGRVEWPDGSRTQIAGSLSDATAAGLFHANCRHRTGLFQPGVTRRMRDTADPQGDADRQQLRYLERGVREWRRREAAALTDDARRQARAKAAEWQARIRAHVRSSSAKRQPGRERLGAR